MWTGDVQSGYPTQWALNPSAYQNLPNEQVDWATLAQQWIQMKETFPVDQVPPAPPPPSIKDDIEAGEAPMDMSKDEPTPNNSTGPSTEQDSNWGNWNNWQQWGGWEWGGAPDKAASSVPPYTYTAPVPPAATSYPPPNEGPTGTATFDYNHGSSLPITDSYDQQGYWSNNAPPYIRNKPSDWRSESRGPNRRQSSVKAEEPEPDTTAMFDAAKRKQLPAWIREGLEKMEREKQKKLERERQLKEKEEEMLRRKKLEEEALASGIPVKSKFETDSEESEKESEEPLVKPRKSRFDATSPVAPKLVVKSAPSPALPMKRKSRDEVLQEVMQQVRYVLTDVLMTVTNEEMQKIAEEVLADFRAKGIAPATQLRKTPALTSLTGKLGLGIYDSDSEDSSDESDSRQDQKNGMDSDEELKERIHRKKQEFARIERDIEHQVEQQEEREREREQMIRGEEERDRQEERDKMDKDQVEPRPAHPGNRSDVKIEETKVAVELKGQEQNHREHFTPERPVKNEKDHSRSRKRDSLDEQSEDSDHDSTSKSDTSSRSSSSSRRKKSRRTSKKKKEKKSSKRKRKRSSSRGSERRKSSRRKSGHSSKYDESWSRPRSRHRRSRSTSYRRHHSRSRSRSRSYSRSHSPDYHYHHSRGKKSSHRSRD